MEATEKRWVIMFSVIVLCITTVPFLLGYWEAGNGRAFSGFFMGVEDGNSYIAKMLTGTAGSWLFRTPYTAYPQQGFLAFLPYLLLGKLVAAPGQHDQLVALFQLFRWAGGFVMVYASYQFVSYFVREKQLRKLGTIIVTIGGGFGWLAFVGLSGIWSQRIPLEVYSPETFGFLSIFTLPHLSMARGLLLLGLLAYWRGYSEAFSRRRSALNGLLWVVLGLMQPLTVLIGWMVIGIDLIVRYLAWKRWNANPGQWKTGLANGLAMGLLSAPLVIYTVASFLADPFLQVWSQQNIITSPPPIDYLMAYGIVVPFLYLGVRRILPEKRVEDVTLLGWIVLLPLLAYFPYNLQRRLPDGIWVALGIVAMWGLATVPKRWFRFGKYYLYTSLLTTLLIIFGAVLSLYQTNTPLYVSSDEVDAFRYLQTRATSFPVVLAAYQTANALPAWAPVRTIIGHGPESIHLKEMQQRVTAFYQSSSTDSERQSLLTQFSIRYILWGPEERGYGSYDPGNLPGVTQVYQNASYQIFEVTP